jgi:hypothetical protein
MLPIPRLEGRQPRDLHCKDVMMEYNFAVISLLFRCYFAVISADAWLLFFRRRRDNARVSAEKAGLLAVSPLYLSARSASVGQVPS